MIGDIPSGTDVTHQAYLRPFEPSFSGRYYPGEMNRCPGCGRSHWIIGRVTAECAFCSWALPLADGGKMGRMAVAA